MFFSSFVCFPFVIVFPLLYFCLLFSMVCLVSLPSQLFLVDAKRQIPLTLSGLGLQLPWVHCMPDSVLLLLLVLLLLHSCCCRPCRCSCCYWRWFCVMQPYIEPLDAAPFYGGPSRVFA